MTRRSIVAVTLAGVCTLGGAAVWAAMTITPASHDFGQLPVNSSASKRFELVVRVGPRAAAFPGSISNGMTATATLTGEGIFACRAYLVSCNYIDHYTGLFTVRNVDSTFSGSQGRKGKWATTVDVRIDKGVVTCSGVQEDWEEEYTGSRLDRRSTSVGPIDGPGLFAIEFSGIGASMEYRMNFVCPSARLQHNSIDYVAGTTATSTTPAEPAQWRHAALAADPQKATKVGMDLVGKQTDVRSDPSNNNDVVGFTGMVWSIKRS